VNEIADETTALERPGSARGFQLPSFRAAALLSFLTLAVFAAWAFLDSQFLLTESIAVYDLPRGRHPWAYSDRQVLPRLILLTLLSATSIAAIGMLFLRLLRGTLADRKLASWFVAITIIGLWMAWFGGRQQIAELGWHWRIRRLIAKLEHDIPQLTKAWPASGELPFLGKFAVEDERVLRSETFLESVDEMGMFPMFEEVTVVKRYDDGAIRFGLLSYRNTFIEYRPDDRPQPIADPPPRQMVRIKPHWFVDKFRRD
jgi:hypothetical protein